MDPRTRIQMTTIFNIHDNTNIVYVSAGSPVELYLTKYNDERSIFVVIRFSRFTTHDTR